MPDIFEVLRSIIDQRRQAGKRTGQFLILESASIELLKQSSDSLAGRIAYVELSGLTVLEIDQTQQTQDQLWTRGGFPESLMAGDDRYSVQWREDFFRTYLAWISSLRVNISSILAQNPIRSLTSCK